ncbi:MAG: photosystem II biogenesis protein Psp29 [Geitlerinemataceae cyanobacterium]
MDSVRTVSDTKREFYSLYTRPIDSIFRRVVEELLVEMHLLSVNADFEHDAIYSLGVVTAFDRFMVGYRTDSERDAIFSAICQATGRTVEQYRNEAQGLLGSLGGLSADDLKATLEQTDASNPFKDALAKFSQRERFKYSRLFGIGLWTAIEAIAPDFATEREDRESVLGSIEKMLGLGGDKLKKDVDLYRGNVEKMKLAREAMAEAVAAERKKRDKRQAEIAAKKAAAEASEDGTAEATGSTETTEEAKAESPADAVEAES